MTSHNTDPKAAGLIAALEDAAGFIARAFTSGTAITFELDDITAESGEGYITGGSAHQELAAVPLIKKLCQALSQLPMVNHLEPTGEIYQIKDGRCVFSLGTSCGRGAIAIDASSISHIHNRLTQISKIPAGCPDDYAIVRSVQHETTIDYLTATSPRQAAELFAFMTDPMGDPDPILSEIDHVHISCPAKSWKK